MKQILLFILISTGFRLSVEAQNLIGSSETAIADSMKKEDTFDIGKKSDGDGGFILTYLNYMHKDGTDKINDDFILVSSQFEIENNKCVGEFYTYKDILLNRFLATFNTDSTKYKSESKFEWVDKKNNLSIKITEMPVQKFFCIQYELKKD